MQAEDIKALRAQLDVVENKLERAQAWADTLSKGIRTIEIDAKSAQSDNPTLLLVASHHDEMWEDIHSTITGLISRRITVYRHAASKLFQELQDKMAAQDVTEIEALDLDEDGAKLEDD